MLDTLSHPLFMFCHDSGWKGCEFRSTIDEASYLQSMRRRFVRVRVRSGIGWGHLHSTTAPQSLARLTESITLDYNVGYYHLPISYTWNPSFCM